MMDQHDREHAHQPRRRAPRAYRSPIAWLTLAVVLALGLTADLFVKSWTFANVAAYPVHIDRERVLTEPSYQPIPYHESKHLIPGVLDARLVINRGAVFGLGQNKRIFFIGFTVMAIMIGVLLFARWTTTRHHLAHVAIGLILAGGIGNLMDRIMFAVVRDFLHLFPGTKFPFGLHWPGGSSEIFPWVFNGADVMLLTGMVLLMFHINRIESRRKKVQSAAAECAAATQDTNDIAVSSGPAPVASPAPDQSG